MISSERGWRLPQRNDILIEPRKTHDHVTRVRIDGSYLMLLLLYRFSVERLFVRGDHRTIQMRVNGQIEIGRVGIRRRIR